MGVEKVVCRTLSDFDKESFRNNHEKHRNAIIVPKEVLESLGVDEFDYVRAWPANREEQAGKRPRKTVLQVIPFGDDHDAENHEVGDRHAVCLRTNLRGVVGLNVENGEEVICLESASDPDERTSVGPLDVSRGSSYAYMKTPPRVRASACYVHEDMRKALGLNENDLVEVMNPEHGGRIILYVRDFVVAAQNDEEERQVRLHSHVRELLGVRSKDQVSHADLRDGTPKDMQVVLRKPKRNFDGTIGRKSVRERIGQLFVDYTEIHLRVHPGLDRDDDRNAVRMSADAANLLGVDWGDRVIVNWYGKRVNARCLFKPDSDGRSTRGFLADGGETETQTEASHAHDDALAIHVPSSERDRIEVSPDDCVTVRRDMGYVVGEKVALSVFGVLGAIIGGLQLADAFVEHPSATVKVSAMILLAVVVLPFLLWPERHRCRNKG